MNSHRKDSVLYDPDISLTEEQLSQEIDILTAELEKYRHVKDRSISQVDTPRTVFRHSDSGIGSVRRSEQLSKQTNSPIYEKNVSSSVNGGGLGARPRSSVRFETSTPAAEKQTSKHFTEQLQFPISDKFVTKRASKTGLTRDTESCEDKQSYPLDGYKNKNIVKTATYDGKGLGLTLGHIGCDRVAVSETINTHPRREIVENGVIFNEVPDSFKTKLVQPRDHYKRTDQAIVGRALVAKGKNHLLLCVEGKSEIRCEDCETVFKKQEYLKRHTKNIHRVETIKRSK
ncbi:Hypothetical predicted protein [Mytilus galloprovincialis]|uniref:C2H2-type domain-containing protein n=1 Tax=Mytilus galloprovincialis TaxID=29158 RepID=A0A8B6D8Y5_MYTGA|nr:Hypothetical predicted protein [Mytilus galloprovincialis]